MAWDYSEWEFKFSSEPIPSWNESEMFNIFRLYCGLVCLKNVVNLSAQFIMWRNDFI